MSDRQTLAEQGAGLCAWGLGALGYATDSALLAPVAIISALIYDKLASRPKTKTRTAVRRAVKALEGHPEIKDRGIKAAAQLLKEQRRKIAIDLETLKDAEKRGEFPDTLYDTVFAGASVPKDDGVEGALRLVVSAAFEELRHEPEFDTVFQQESLKAIEAAQAVGFERVVKLLERAEEERSAILRNVSIGQIETAEHLADLQDSYRSLKNDYGTIAKSLKDLRSLKRRDLEYIALKFGISLDRESTDDQIVAVIADSASDFLVHSERAEERRATPQIAELKRQAAAARADLQFIDADRLYAEIAAIEREIADETLARVEAAKETARAAIEDYSSTLEDQAANALDAKRPEDAYELYNTAADAFGEVDPIKLIEKKNLYAVRLYRHGVKFGQNAIHYSSLMTDDVLLRDELKSNLELWITVKNSSIAFAAEAARLMAPEDYEDAQIKIVEGFREIEGVLDPASDARRLAVVKNNVANALRDLSDRSNAKPSQKRLWLDEAITKFAQANELRDREAVLEDWLETKVNYAAALESRGLIADEGNQFAYFEKSIEAYESAIQELQRAEKQDLQAWAETNFTSTLRSAAKTAGSQKAKIKILQRSIEVARRAENASSGNDDPWRWAEAKYSLALSEELMASSVSSSQSRAHLMSALSHAEQAVNAYDPEHMKYNYERATRLRDDLKARLAEFD